MGLVRAVIRSFERGIAPLRLAESWDNVGLLLESPKYRSSGGTKIMLTIDLTPAVVEEALANDTGVIVAYHPPIFSGLKSLTLTNPLQRSLLRCAAEGISIFSPHTALDSVRDGVNDTFAASLGDLAESNLIGEEKENGAGAGRIVTLSQPVNLETLCERVKVYCGLKHLQVGVPAEADSQRLIHTIAICAGSGGSLLKGVQAHVYLTGEMSHHEVLAAVAQGTSVILCGHSNTERPYLPTLQKKLQQALDDDDELAGESYNVIISKSDADPLTIM
ncbi:GTP cyclohydrolase 1 type 2/Nif3 [Rhizoctonia solani]|nr:GTP cyclohydrolase 1 type 2/Nif3 [Rhizoctonia solani]